MPGPVQDEAALVRRYLGWARHMPVGRIEVEGARVHLLRADRAARHSFSLGQAVVSRGNDTLNAHGTLLLSQDVGQSLFVSARLQNVGSDAGVSGDVRVIARRVFLDQLAPGEPGGRGTIDASVRLQDGRVESGTWQANARELALPGGPRFDHVSANGRLSRDAGDVLLDITDLQLTRGGRLERAPLVNVRLALVPGSMDIARASVRAERVPFMAAELGAAGAARYLQDASAAPADWKPVAGELRDLRFDSGDRRGNRGWSLSANVSGVELTRESDQTRLLQLAAGLQLGAGESALRFDPDQAVILHVANSPAARQLLLSGRVARTSSDGGAAWRFEEFSAGSAATKLVATGNWDARAARGKPLSIEATALDREWLQDVWRLVGAQQPPPQLLASVAQANILEATLELSPAADGTLNWERSSGSLSFESLATSGDRAPPVSAGRGALKFARGGARLELAAGRWEQLDIRDARLDWPRRGAPRLRVALDGNLDAPPLRAMLESHGLERLVGGVAIEAEARGENELRDPASWRLVAHLSDAQLPLEGDLPRIEGLAGTVRYSAGQLRSLALAGRWLGGPVEVESRRAGSRGELVYAVKGVAEAAPLLRLAGQPKIAEQVTGEFAWTGTARPGPDGQSWQLAFSSNLGGVASSLPGAFAKTPARALPVKAELGVSRAGIEEFRIEGPRGIEVQGRESAGVTTIAFNVQGISGEVRRFARAGVSPELKLERLDVMHAPEVLATAALLLPDDGELQVRIDDVRRAARSFGPMQASLQHQPRGISFAAESSVGAIHQLSLQGDCVAGGRCRAQFSAATAHLGSLLRDAKLPVEWPAAELEAAGELGWPADMESDPARSLAGNFVLQTLGADGDHQLTAQATISDGQIVLSDVQGTGPEPDLVFRGNGRIDLVAREYEATVDYQRVALAATAVPSPARARLARAWNAMRGSVARRGWSEAPDTRRVQWHGSWD